MSELIDMVFIKEKVSFHSSNYDEVVHSIETILSKSRMNNLYEDKIKKYISNTYHNNNSMSIGIVVDEIKKINKQYEKLLISKKK